MLYARQYPAGLDHCYASTGSPVNLAGLRQIIHRIYILYRYIFIERRKTRNVCGWCNVYNIFYVYVCASVSVRVPLCDDEPTPFCLHVLDYIVFFPIIFIVSIGTLLHFFPHIYNLPLAPEVGRHRSRLRHFCVCVISRLYYTSVFIYIYISPDLLSAVCMCIHIEKSPSWKG